MSRKSKVPKLTEDDRPMVLSLLRSMGVILPAQTKLPIEELDKKLGKSLDSAQRISREIPEPPLNPASLHKWTGKDGSVLSATKIASVSEAIQNMRTDGSDSVADIAADAFTELRQTVMHLGDNFDKRRTVFLVQDAERTSAIALRVVDVFMLNKETPVFTVLFDHATGSKPSPASVEFIQSHLSQGVTSVNATLQEQRLLLRLLRLNAKRLTEDYSPKRGSMEEDFELSFLLPLGPVSQSDLAKLIEYSGCVICGKPNKSKCARCLAESYCSKECQRSDWSNHKRFCKSVEGGNWSDIKFIKTSMPKGFNYAMYLNRFTASDDLRDTEAKDVDEVPVNAYGKRAFVVKIQKALNLADVLIYDRRQSIKVHVTPASDEEAMKNIGVAVMKSSTPGKIYRWAKRTGEFTLSICLDKEPQEDTSW